MPRTPSKREKQQRIRDIIALIAKATPKGKIKAAIKEKYGIGARACETYLRLARAAILAEADLTRDEARAECYHRLLADYANPTATVRDRTQINQQLCKLLGLNTPEEVIGRLHVEGRLAIAEIEDPDWVAQNDGKAADSKDAAPPKGGASK